MQAMYAKQQGISFIGIVFGILILAFFVLFGLRLFPLYNEKFTVITTMNNLAEKSESNTWPVKEVRKYFMKNMQIANINRFDDKSIKEQLKIIRDKRAKKTFLHVTYEARNVFFKDIGLILIFDRKVELGVVQQQ